MKMDNLENNSIIANPKVFEVGKPSKFAKKIIKESDGKLKTGAKGFKTVKGITLIALIALL